MAFVGLQFAAVLGGAHRPAQLRSVLGSVLGVLFPVLMAIVQFGDVGTVLAVLVPLTVVQFVIGNFVDPLVMSNSLNLSPFAILVSLAVWTACGAFPARFWPCRSPLS